MLTPATMPLTPASADVSPTTASLHGLDGVNFFLAGVLAGFGPYVAVYLADQKWTQEKIGFVLSASALAGLLSQVPGANLLDSAPRLVAGQRRAAQRVRPTGRKRAFSESGARLDDRELLFDT